MVSKAKVAGAIIGAGVGVGLLAYLIKAAAAAPEKVLTMNISYDSVNGCASGAPITFEGRYTVRGESIDGTEIYVVNETTNERFGPALTANGGYYSYTATAPLTEGTYQYRAYTEDQLAGLLGLGLPERGAGLKLGTARTGEERGRGKALTDEERRARHMRIF